MQNCWRPCRAILPVVVVMQFRGGVGCGTTGLCLQVGAGNGDVGVGYAYASSSGAVGCTACQLGKGGKVYPHVNKEGGCGCG